MQTRPAWGALIAGALLVIALIFSPIWLKEFSDYIEEPAAQAPFPDAFYQLSSQAQDLYLDLYEGESRQMAIDLVAARLAEPVDVEEPNLPAIDPIRPPCSICSPGILSRWIQCAARSAWRACTASRMDAPLCGSKGWS